MRIPMLGVLTIVVIGCQTQTHAAAAGMRSRFNTFVTTHQATIDTYKPYAIVMGSMLLGGMVTLHLHKKIQTRRLKKIAVNNIADRLASSDFVHGCHTNTSEYRAYHASLIHAVVQNHAGFAAGMTRLHALYDETQRLIYENFANNTTQRDSYEHSTKTRPIALCAIHISTQREWFFDPTLYTTQTNEETKKREDAHETSRKKEKTNTDLETDLQKIEKNHDQSLVSNIQRRLPTLQPGEVIIIRYSDGSTSYILHQQDTIALGSLTDSQIVNIVEAVRSTPSESIGIAQLRNIILLKSSNIPEEMLRTIERYRQHTLQNQNLRFMTPGKVIIQATMGLAVSGVCIYLIIRIISASLTGTGHFLVNLTE